MAARIPHPKSKRDQRPPLEPIPQAQDGSGQRVIIRYRRFTTAPLDAENFAGSTKALTDLLRTVFDRDIADDSPEFVEIHHAQTRVRSRDEEGTWVTLEFLNDQRQAASE